MLSTFSKSHLISISGSALALAMLYSAPAMAQSEAPAQTDAAPVESADEAPAIVVTGSRIARPELDVANPIVAVSAEELTESGRTNITDILVRNPALSASTDRSLAGGADVGAGGTGLNLLSLRNLGTERTLVLVNGKRHVGGSADSVSVDINSIPQDLIEKVDVLTGGASAIYGADGVSGVVNFVLKRNFEGLSARGEAGVSSRGDAGTQFVSILAGKNFADDRGNVALSYEYNQSDRLTAFSRSFSGTREGLFALIADQDEFTNDTPGRVDRILYNDLGWWGSSPDGAIDLDLDGNPDFTGSGSPYDAGLFLNGSPGYGTGGSSNTQVAGYYGDLLPQTERHAANLLASFEISPALRVYGEGKYVKNRAFSVGQPTYLFFNYLQPDNAFLVDRFGAAASANGALISRDNFDLGARGETITRETVRTVIGADGQLTENLRYDASYIFGRTSSRYSQTNNVIADRFFAALDSIRDPATGQIVCRSTLFPAGNIDPDNLDLPATTFTPGAGSPCRPLNLLGEGVATPESVAFVTADNLFRERVAQEVVTGYVSGDFDSLFTLPGGSLGFALGAEYRREKSEYNPDPLFINDEILLGFQAAPSSGAFTVKEAFAELNVPLLADRPFFDLLSFSAALRLSDYSTVGSTTTWKVDGIYSPVRDIKFRGSYSQAVRAPNIGELFLPESGTSTFVTDPCDFRRINDGTSFRAANCTTILSGLGLTPAQIAAFSPSSDPVNTTSRRSLVSGNANLQEETARTWTAGVVLQPRFIPGLTMTFDWYNIRIRDAVNTPTGTELAELCVDQPTVDNVFCDNIFRNQGTGFILGDSNDTQKRIGLRRGPQNVAKFETSGADFTANYRFSTANLGRFNLRLVGGYLNKITFVPSIGADVDDDTLEAYNPRWRGSAGVNWTLGNFSAGYTFTYFSKTRRFTTEQLAANPDISDPRFFFYDERAEHDVRLGLTVDDRFEFYGGVNNIFDQKPTLVDLSYPVSGLGRYLYVGAKVSLGK